MKKTVLLFAVAGMLSLQASDRVVPGTPKELNNKTTPGYASPAVNARLNISVDEKTDIVHFIQDNADPHVVTKAYRLKSADPYVARGYVRSAVGARKVDSSPVQVAALKYSDGSAFLLVSAEEYRFSDSRNGEGIDTIIAKLDKAGLATVSNDFSWVYFPKHLPAATLMNMLTVVGSSKMDPQFAISPDSMMVDGELNMLMVCSPAWSGKIMKEMLEKYDHPMPEVHIGYKVIEIYAENDDRIGVDFQSWKNNDGVDLFSTGARVRRNWSSFFHGGVDNTGNNRTSYWNFNPKWNTRYLDFLTSIGKAKVLTSGTLLAKNRETSSITLNYGYFYERTDYSVNAGYGMGEFAYTDPNPDAIYRQQVAKIMPGEMVKEWIPNTTIAAFYPRMVNYLDGAPAWKLDLVDATGALTTAGTALVNKITEIAKSEGAAKAAQLVAAGKLNPSDVASWVANYAGEYVEEYISSLTSAAKIMMGTYETHNPNSSEGMPGVIHGKLQIPMVKDGFLFDLKLRPVITGSAASIEFDGHTISLLGWNSDGSPRNSESNINTKFQVGYGNQEFVIGGLRRTETVRSVAGLPFLKDIPILGLLFSTENESIKQAQLVVIATVDFATPTTSHMTQENTTRINEVIKKVNRGVDSKVGNMFFQHYKIDTDEIK